MFQQFLRQPKLPRIYFEINVYTIQAKVQEKINLDDLHTNETEVIGSSLRLVHMDRYLHGPTPVTATHYNTGEDILHSCQAVMQEMLAWHPQLTQVGHFTPVGVSSWYCQLVDLCGCFFSHFCILLIHAVNVSPQVLPSASAMNVLGELSPGGALMQGHTQQQLHREFHSLCF